MHNLDITLILAVWMAASIAALPLLAFTARFGLVPLVEAVAEVRAAGRAPLPGDTAELRIAGIERGLAALAASVERIADAQAADAQPVLLAAKLLGGDSHLTAGAHGGHPSH